MPIFITQTVTLFYQVLILLHTGSSHGTIQYMNPVFWQNILIYFLFVWSLFWKGIALWRSAQLKQRNWFVVILVLNTVGILELIYLFRFAKKRLTIDEMKTWKQIFVRQVHEKK